VYSWQEFESSLPSKNDGVERERFSLQDETLLQADLVVKMKHSASYGRTCSIHCCKISIMR
jgi:hypothetical protein